MFSIENRKKLMFISITSFLMDESAKVYFNETLNMLTFIVNVQEFSLKLLMPDHILRHLVTLFKSTNYNLKRVFAETASYCAGD